MLFRSEGETPRYFRNAWNVIQPAIIAKQSTDGIDTVSGATYSSEGILYGAKSALEQALKTSDITATPNSAIRRSARAAISKTGFGASASDRISYGSPICGGDSFIVAVSYGLSDLDRF